MNIQEANGQGMRLNSKATGRREKERSPGQAFGGVHTRRQPRAKRVDEAGYAPASLIFFGGLKHSYGKSFFYHDSS